MLKVYIYIHIKPTTAPIMCFVFFSEMVVHNIIVLDLVSPLLNAKLSSLNSFIKSK